MEETVLTNAVSVSSGESHSVALLSDGTVAAWGSDNWGQIDVPAGLSNVAVVVAGPNHCLAVKQDGTVAAWGSWTFPIPATPVSVPSGLSNVVAVAGGNAHSVALKADGTVVAWGDDYYGQLNVPPGLSNVVAIAAGYYFTIALRADGSIVGWPGAPQPNTSNAVAIAANYTGTLALTTNGAIIGGDSLTNVPPGLSNVVAIACGYSVGNAVGPSVAPTAFPQTASATVNAQQIVTLQGTDLNGQALAFRVVSLPQAGSLYQYAAGVPGAEITETNTYVTDSGGRLIFIPSPGGFGQPYASFSYVANDGELDSLPATVTINVIGLPYVATQPAVFIGDITNAVLEGTVVPNGLETRAWFQWGQQGNMNQVTPPQDVGAGASVVQVSWPVSNLVAGTVYQCRLIANNAAALSLGAVRLLGYHDLGKVAAWGENTYHETALPTGLTNVVAVAASGGYHTLALKADGTVVAWGSNLQGQTNVPLGLRAVSVGAGAHHSLALKEDGTVAAWGWNTYGETNVPAGLSNVIAVAGGGDQSLALKADGTVMAWGDNSSKQATVPVGLSNVVAIAGGSDHSIALRADGTLLGWGANTFGQISIPPSLTNAVALASGGGNFSLALRTDGTVVAWGDNLYGECNIPPGLSNVVAIGAGAYNGFAVRSDGTLVAWGDNSRGQTNLPPGLANVVQVNGGALYAVVRADNLPPAAIGITATGYPNHDLPVRLQGSDPNGDALSFSVTSLPAVGVLYQYAGGSRGPAISNVGTVVSDPNGQVIFSPGTNSLGSPYAVFAYLANDGETNSMPTNGTIDIILPQRPQMNTNLAYWVPGNGFEFTFSGSSNATYRIWASTNLVNWTPLGTATPTSNGWFQFFDLDSTGLAQRFYRAGAP